MKPVLLAALVAAASLVSPVTLVVSSAAIAKTCDESSPAEWQRPGGYCDQANSTSPKVELTPGSPVPPPKDRCSYLPADFFLKKGMRVRVAC